MVEDVTGPHGLMKEINGWEVLFLKGLVLEMYSSRARTGHKVTSALNAGKKDCQFSPLFWKNPWAKTKAFWVPLTVRDL